MDQTHSKSEFSNSPTIDASHDSSHNRHKTLKKIAKPTKLLHKEKSKNLHENSMNANQSSYLKKQKRDAHHYSKEPKTAKHGVQADWNVNMSLFDREIFRKIYSIDYELESMKNN